MSALILWFEQRERQLQQSTKGARKTLRDLKQARTAH